MSSRLRQRDIFSMWSPLAATWLMMSVEGPFLAALIARLAEPKPNLAAYGVAFAVAIFIEAPVIMLVSASTALADSRDAFVRLRRFSVALSLAMSALMLLFWLPGAFGGLAKLMDLPDSVAEHTRVALLLLLPWPAAIGYRRFYQGLLIRFKQSRRVAYGTVVRLVAMASTGLGLAFGSSWSGAAVGAAALSAGVCGEAVATRWMARGIVRELPHNDTNPSLTYGRIAGFYYPLALTSTITLTSTPLLTFFMGQSNRALESLAVLPVVLTFTFIFRSAGLSFQEVAIAIIGQSADNRAPLARFATSLGLGASALLAAIAFTPLATAWFRGISGLSDELTHVAIVPTQILSLAPALSVLLAYQRALLVDRRETRPISWASGVEVGGLLLAAWLLVSHSQLVGVTIAAIALLAGRSAGIVSLAPAAWRRTPRAAEALESGA